MCDSLPSHLPTMAFSNIKIKRENSIKFLGVIIDEKLIWKNHIEVAENKNIGVLYRASHLLDLQNLLKTYFHFVHIISVMLILIGLVLLKLNSRES